MRVMINIRNIYSNELAVNFDVKNVEFSCGCRENLNNHIFELGRPMEYTENWPHLGHIPDQHHNNSMSK
jgi:hypothetical protein